MHLFISWCVFLFFRSWHIRFRLANAKTLLSLIWIPPLRTENGMDPLFQEGNYDPCERSMNEMYCTWFLNHIPLDKMVAIMADDNFKCIFLNEIVRISIKISLKFVPTGPIDCKSALVQVMAWRRTRDKPLPGPMPIQVTNTYMWY